MLHYYKYFQDDLFKKSKELRLIPFIIKYQNIYPMESMIYILIVQTLYYIE